MNKRQDISPPKWADRFLELYCKEEFLEEIQGDVYELFEVRVNSQRPLVAKTKFIWDVIRFFKWSNIKKSNRLNFTQFTMVKNNLKIASRSLRKYKFYTGINLIGISLGIACFILTFLYVQDELSYDKFHSSINRIYRVWVLENDEGEEYYEGVVPIVMATPLKNDYPQIENVVQVWGGIATYTSPDQRTITSEVTVVGEDFLEVFDFKLLSGKRENILSQPEQIVLTESEAIRRFGSIDVLGETIDYTIRGNDLSFLVSGIIENPPKNSSIQYASLISDVNNTRIINEHQLNNWFVYSTEIYVRLNNDVDVPQLVAEFEEMVKTALGEDYEEGLATINLQPMTQIHFDTQIEGDTTPGNLGTVRILGIVGFVILLLAGINFINLSVGQSMKRSKEVGVRKVMGAFKGQLMLQFLSESLILTILAGILGVFISSLLLPIFNEFADKTLELTFSTSLFQALAIAILIIGIMSGIYPALVLSSFKPVVALKSGNLARNGKNGLAYSLIVIQFLTAIFFVSSTLIMKNQIKFLSEKDLGFDKEAKVYFRLPRAKGNYEGMSQIMEGNGLLAEQVIERLKQLPNIERISRSNNYFGDEGWILLDYKNANGETKEFHFNHIGEDFVDLFKIEILEGDGFRDASENVRKTGVIVNEAFVREMGLENPIGAKIAGDRFGEHRIIGVTKDFHYATLHERIRPLVMSMNTEPILKGINGISINQSTRATVIASIKLDNIQELSKQIEAVWNERFSEPFELKFIDTRLERMYENEKRTNAMVTLVAILAITIACLGLLGLAALTIKNRFKEIGIRKVLGANTSGIVKLLYRAFVSPVVVAFTISIPLTVYVMDGWLDNFAYQIDIQLVHFIIIAFGTLLVTAAVVSYQSLKAAITNPVDILRYE